MKVLLINPPIRDFYSTPLRRQPLGLLYVAAALREAGHEVELLDSGAAKKTRRLAVPEGMAEAVPGGDGLDASPFKLFGRYYHFGPAFEEIEEKIRASAPDVTGISSLFSAYSLEALQTARAARRAVPFAPVILGGGHPSCMPERVLRHPEVDFAVVGEGEEAFPALLEVLERGKDPAGIAGVAVRGGRGVPRVTPPVFRDPIDTFPEPARDLLNLDAYRLHGRRMAQMLSSRGCPYGCAFCSAHRTSGRLFRARHPVRVVEEMVACRERFHIEAFDFEDDNLTCDVERAEALMGLIIEAFGEGALRLEAMNGISMKGMTPRLLDRMRRAGFRSINLSPLSTGQRVRTSMGRPEAVSEAVDTPRKASEAGLRVTAYLMTGYPEQHLSEMMAALARWAAEPVLLAPSIFYPAPGSKIQEERFPALKDADEETWGLTRSSLFPPMPGGPSRETLRTVFWLTRLVNFARTVSPNRDVRVLRDRCLPFLEGTGWEASGPIGTQDVGGAAGRDGRPGRDRTAGRGRVANHDTTARLNAPRALKAAERGLAALALYLLRRLPHGIRLVRRGGSGSPWFYEVFPLEGMIKDRTFYTAHGVPGFDPGRIWIDGDDHRRG